MKELSDQQKDIISAFVEQNYNFIAKSISEDTIFCDWHCRDCMLHSFCETVAHYKIKEFVKTLIPEATL